MTTIVRQAGRFQRTLCLTLAVATGSTPSVSALAQTNAAAMSVRQRFEGTTPEGRESQQPPGAPGPGPAPGQVLSPGSDAGKIDTRYISPQAVAVVVVRPAQILMAPIAQMLPVELVTASLGFDPAEIDEIVAFADAPTAGLNYGVTLKFKNPIRASSIPPERRDHVQLAELGGKKYMKSASPLLYSLYAPNNRTLVAATDVALQQLVASAGQPKSGPMMDRLREVPAGSDLYVTLDVASLRPLLPMVMGGDPSKAPPAAKKLLEALEQVSAAELTLNISNPGPSSFVARCTDDAAAQKLEMLAQEAKQMAKGGAQAEQAGMVSPTEQAALRYQDRLLQMLPLQREGVNFVFFRVDGQNPAQQQFVAAAVVLTVSTLPQMLAAQKAALHPQGAPGVGPLPGAPGAPGSPEAAPPQ